jgi:hypothetical protein
VSGLRLRDMVGLLVLPTLFLAASLILRAHAMPYWLWFNLDPSYLYLLDGMQLLEGVTPGNVNHPGTSVQCIVALVVWLSHLGGPSGIADGAFAAAEMLLRRASTVMLGLDAAGLVTLGWVVRRRFGALVPACLAQTAPFISMLTLKHGIEVEPEPMLLFAVALLAAAMIEYASRPRGAMIIAMGVVVGFGAACKITFAPLGLAPLLLVAGWRQRALFCIAAALAVAFFLLPAIGGAGRAAQWFFDLATHSGTYGSGPPMVVDAARYPHAVVKLFLARPLFWVPYFTSAGVLLFRRRRGLAFGGAERTLFAILMAQLVQILLVAKHPSGHYILPALELSGPVLALLWWTSRDLAGEGPARARLAAAAAGILGLILVGQSVAFLRQDREIAGERVGALAIDTARAFPGCAHVYFDMASSPTQAWLYNMNFGQHPFGAQLAAMLPADDFSYLDWVGRLQDRAGFVDPAAVAARYRCIVLRGTDIAMLRRLAPSFGPLFDEPHLCRAGSEYLLAAGAPCPAGTGS